MILLLSGEDTYRSRKRLDVLIEAFKKKFDPSGFNVSFFEGNSPSFDSVQSALGTMSFLGDRRLLVFYDFFSAKTSEQQKKILSYLLERDSDEQVVIFRQRGSLPGASSRLSFVKNTKHEEFPFLTGITLSRWITDEAKKRELKLAPSAISLLVERIGGDLWKTANVLDQLSSFVGKGEAGTEQVKAFTEVALNDNIFHLTDALGKKQTKQALELLFDQLRSGAHPLYLVTMLMRHFTILLKVSVGGSNLASETGVHPFAIRKASEQLHLFPLAELKMACVELQSIESQLKRGAKDPETLLSRFIFRVAQ